MTRPNRIHTLQPNSELPHIPVEGVSVDSTYLQSNGLVVPVMWAIPKEELTPDRGTVMGLGYGATINAHHLTSVAVTAALTGERVIAPLTPLAANKETARHMGHKISSRQTAEVFRDVLPLDERLGFANLHTLDVIAHSKDSHVMTEMVDMLDDKEIAALHIIDPVNLLGVRSIAFRRRIRDELRFVKHYIGKDSEFKRSRLSDEGRSSLPTPREIKRHLEAEKPDGIVNLRLSRGDLKRGFAERLAEVARDKSRQQEIMRVGLWRAAESLVSSDEHIIEAMSQMAEHTNSRLEVEAITINPPENDSGKEHDRPRHGLVYRFDWFAGIVTDALRKQ